MIKSVQVATWKPGTEYTRASATAKAKELNPFAFAKLAEDCPAAERYQVLVEAESYVDEDGVEYKADGTPFVFLVASGADWVEALANFYEWQEAQKEAAMGKKKGKGCK